MTEKLKQNMNTFIKKRPLLFQEINNNGSDFVKEFLTVFDTGEICLFSLKVNKNNLMYYNNIEGISAGTLYKQEEKSTNTDGFLFDKMIPISCFSPPIVFTNLEMIKNKSLIRAELSSSGRFLLIYGFIHEKIPSFGVFTFQNYSLQLIFSDSIISVSSASFLAPNDLIICLPRNISGCVSFVSLQTKLPQHFEHRLIPRIIFSGHHTPRMTHVVASPTENSHWQFVTWNDDDKTLIGLWRLTTEITDVSKLMYIETMIEPVIDIFIYNILFSPDGQKIFILLQGDSPNNLYGWIWELHQDSISQFNYLVRCGGYSSILSVQWISLTTVELVSTYGIFEISSFGVSPLLYSDISDSISENSESNDKISESNDNFSESNDKTSNEKTSKTPDDVHKQKSTKNNEKDNLIITAMKKIDNIGYVLASDGIPRQVFIQKNGDIPSFGLKKPNDFRVIALASVTLLKTTIKGECKGIVGMHLYRCANCKMPLLYPLISRSDDGKLECAYCSRNCQEQHWPKYVAIHKNVFFEDEMD